MHRSVSHNLRSAVIEAVDASNLSHRNFESAKGLPPWALKGLLAKDWRAPSLDKAKQIADAIGLELYIGPPRDTAPTPSADPESFAHIPLHEALLAAGGGAMNGSEAVIDHLAFRRDWLSRIGAAPASARLARIHGDSMEPSIFEGDMILIDTRRTDPPIRKRDARDQRRGGIYALIDDGVARVKRVERPAEDMMILVSDNPDYAPEIRQGDEAARIEIIGKVLWWGHTARE